MEKTSSQLSSNKEIRDICKGIFKEVQKNGDKAVAKYTWFFDKVKITNFQVSEKEINESESLVPENLKEAILLAKSNIENFHRAQTKFQKVEVEENSCKCWQEVRAIEKVGLYIPGGTAPLFSTVLMLAIPAKIANCKNIILLSPPNREGKINPVILWTAKICGIKNIYKAGGVQAIAAMTFGTESIPNVYKIFGPGNAYVMQAKQLALNYGVAIDMPAGPSELMVIADESAKANFVASDLLSQAEHGVDSKVALLTTVKGFIEKVKYEIQLQLEKLPRKDIISMVLANNFISKLLPSIDACLDIANDYAPEHLIICTHNYNELVPKITNAGSVFLGNYSPESAGDYASGTNHTLPTSSYAKMYSGISVDSFTKKIFFQEISKDGLSYLSKAIEIMAENENLDAHANAVKIRMNCDINKYN